MLMATCIAVIGVLFYWVIRRDFMEKEEMFKRSAENIRAMAYYDDLTGLPNRRYFHEQLEQALKRRHPWSAVLAVDIDRFRLFNDTLGHNFGDLILLQAAERLTRCVRDGDTVSRMEGDEFFMLYPSLRHRDDIDKIVRRIHDSFRSPFTYQDYELHTTVSIGVAARQADDEVDADTLIKQASVALSRAKEQADVPYELYTPSMDQKFIEKLTLENELRRAISQHEFILHFQPQVEIETNRVIGIEALVRWHHPSKGLIPPGRFIPEAEENGLITPISEWVLSEACKQTKILHNLGYSHLNVSVNLSSRQFLQNDLAERVAKVLEETGFPAEHLELEITEGMTMDIERSMTVLHDLHKLGVRISIDDFGTGYSSLNYLKKLPIHKLKIDRSFVRDIMEDPSDAAIVSTIISMARHLNLKVIAEGVETVEQIRYLNEQRCHEIQGYIFSQPIPHAELIQLLDRQQGIDAAKKDNAPEENP